MEEIRGMKDKSYLFEAAVTELTMNVLDSGEGFLAGEGEYPLPGKACGAGRRLCTGDGS